jgi:ATPase family associated with various cellular activities (AAA)
MRRVRQRAAATLVHRGEQVRRFAGGGNTTDGTFAPVSRHGRAQRAGLRGWLRRLRERSRVERQPEARQPPRTGTGGLASLPGLETVTEQLAGPIAVLRAEQARCQAGAAVTRPAWKNLVFTGGPGSGKTRAARAVTRIYTELGLLSFGVLREIAAADLIGTTLQKTGALVAETARHASGDLLMINDAHAWYGLPDRGRHLLRCLYKELTDSGGQLAVILAGRQGPLRDMLHADPALAARFPAVIGFPGYTAGQLAAIFATLAGEAGFTLTTGAARKAATVLARAEVGHGSGNARLAVRLLDQVTARQARRITTAASPWIRSR